jgi:hypothetical protein
MAIDQSTSLEEILNKWAIAFKENSKRQALSYGCQHDIREYIGFSEQYEYCIKCDAKKVDGDWQQSEKLRKLIDLF